MKATLAQSSRWLDWAEDPSSKVTGFAITVDGVRTDLGLTPEQANGSCGCSTPLPFSTGRHTVVVSAYNSTGETASAPLIVGPTAQAGGPYSGQAGATLSVSGTGSTDATGTITGYFWKWGDGTPDSSSSSPTASHTYANAGTFTMTLTVSDNLPASHSATTSATIAAPSPPGTPGSPTPVNGASGVSLTPTLTWSAAGAMSYDVQFGGSNPPAVVALNQTSASYSPPALTGSKPYYWRIVAHNSAGASAGVTPGPVWSFTTAASSSGDVVIHAVDIPTTALHGMWSRTADPTSPGGIKLASADNGLSSTAAPNAAPADYFDVTFDATAGTPYTIWLRIQGLADSKWNDSLWVQFSDALASGAPIYPIGTTSGLLVNLATDASGGSDQLWGWQNTAYWLRQPTTVTFATNGTHTLRIQAREDGVALDQIVLSPGTYLQTAPGAVSNDSTIVLPEHPNNRQLKTQNP